MTHGERQVWRVVHVPSVEAEDQRHLHRDLETLKQERASTTTRIKGLLSSQGVRLTSLSKLPEQLEALRLWDGSPIPSGLRRRVLRVYAHHQFLSAADCGVGSRASCPAAHLAGGQHREGASVDASERHRDQWGMVVGDGIFWLARVARIVARWVAERAVTPTPYHSGESAREQGITKSGNRHVRWMTTELAWSWVRYQPESALSGWFRERFGGGGKRLRRIGIVAVARKLLIALWRFLETGVLPEGAALKEA